MVTSLDLVPLLANFAASALGALAAGYFGVLWALRQRRAERAFDRRIEWTEEMHAALHAAADTQNRLFNVRRFPDVPHTEIDEADRDADQAYREMRRLSEARRLYAPPATSARLGQALDEINLILYGAASTGHIDPWGARCEWPFRLAGKLREAADILTEDVHVYLGYVPWWRRALERRRKHPESTKVVSAERQAVHTTKLSDG